LTAKEKEIHSVEDKIVQSKAELKKAKNKHGKTEGQKMVDYEKRIKANEAKSKELIQEIK